MWNKETLSGVVELLLVWSMDGHPLSLGRGVSLIGGKNRE